MVFSIHNTYARYNMQYMITYHATGLCAPLVLSLYISMPLCLCVSALGVLSVSRCASVRSLSLTHTHSLELSLSISRSLDLLLSCYLALYSLL